MQVEISQSDRGLVAKLAGDWKLGLSAPRFDELLGERTAERAAAPAASVAFDTSELGSWDSSLLTFLEQGIVYCEANGLQFEESSLPEDVVRLLELARAVPEQEIEPEPKVASRIDRIGLHVLSTWDAFLVSMAFVGMFVSSLSRLARRRFHLRWKDFWLVVQSNGIGALPIVGLIAFLVGLIISFLGAVVLQQFGAGYYVSYLVGYGMLREMGALMTGIIMAGRTGAAFAAELGSMKITEEIDALETLGISPVDHLVMPRVLGLFVMMPMLTVYADFIGMIGGMIVAIAFLDLSATQFIGGLLTPIVISDALLGVVKGTVFGLIIGLSGCMRGLQTGTDAGAVGRSATSAVVTGITLIILANAVFDWLAVLLNF